MTHHGRVRMWWVGSFRHCARYDVYWNTAEPLQCDTTYLEFGCNWQHCTLTLYFVCWEWADYDIEKKSDNTSQVLEEISSRGWVFPGDVKCSGLHLSAPDTTSHYFWSMCNAAWNKAGFTRMSTAAHACTHMCQVSCIVDPFAASDRSCISWFGSKIWVLAHWCWVEQVQAEYSLGTQHTQAWFFNSVFP